MIPKIAGRKQVTPLKRLSVTNENNRKKSTADSQAEIISKNSSG